MTTRTGKLGFGDYFKKKQQIKRDTEEREVTALLAKVFPKSETQKEETMSEEFNPIKFYEVTNNEGATQPWVFHKVNSYDERYDGRYSASAKDLWVTLLSRIDKTRCDSLLIQFKGQRYDVTYFGGRYTLLAYIVDRGGRPMPQPRDIYATAHPETLGKLVAHLDGKQLTIDGVNSHRHFLEHLRD